MVEKEDNDISKISAVELSLLNSLRLQSSSDYEYFSDPSTDYSAFGTVDFNVRIRTKYILKIVKLHLAYMM